MGDVDIDARLFHKRVRFLLSAWKNTAGHNDPEAFPDVDSILVVVGNADEEIMYPKSTSLQTWLLGYEFPSTLLLLTKDDIYFVASKKKASYLQSLNEGGDRPIPVHVHERTKDNAENKATFQKFVDVMKNVGKRIGILPKDKFTGSFIDEWKEVYTEADVKWVEQDIGPSIAAVMAIKDEEEMRSMRTAAKLSSAVMSKHFVDEMSAAVDEERKVTHEALAESVEKVLDNTKFFNSGDLKLPQDFDAGATEWCYTPIIQSGGKYDLRPSAFSDSRNLHSGAIIATLGVRYKSYCSNVGRTFLIDPTKTQEKHYAFLLELQESILGNIREGAVIKDVYDKALKEVKAKFPDLESHFVKNLGSVIGIEFRDSAYTINTRNPRQFKNGMVVNLSVGFQDLANEQAADKESKVYSLLLIDTIRVTNEHPIVMTDCAKSLNDISYMFKDDGDSEEEAKKAKEAEKRREQKRKAAAQSTAVLKSKLRNEEQVDASTEQKRRAHQKELADKKQQQGLERFGNSDDHQKSDTAPKFKKFESYKRDTQLPTAIKDLQIVVDSKNHSIILPLYGLAVPFHISTLKNISKNDEGEYVYLRLNFLTPGQATGKKEDMPFDDPQATFVRSVTFRSSDTYHMGEVFRMIQDLKRDASKKEAERREMADVVEQEDLREVKGRRPIKLPDVFVRPGLDSRRTAGDVEIHSNGLRYQSPVRSDHRIDLLFSNIKNLFFQPCDNELIVILHVHLKNPIMVGKRKYYDIQFYREASDVQFDETNNRKRKYRYGDEDELEAEQEERRRRAALNKEFRAFSEKITEASDGKLEVDIPFRELGFQGVPFRTNVLLQPTTDCLVHLTDPPFLVVTLAEVEIAHLERVQFGLKNFDLVFVFSDFQKAPLHINTIPTTQLDNVKEWLDSVDIAFTEGPVNLAWPAIMKTINDDPSEFFLSGGWEFLQAESDNEDGSGSDDSASEFEVESDAFEEESDESSFSDDVDASADSGSEDEEVESGEDWDALEEKAAKADAKREQGGDEPISKKQKR